MAKVLVLSLWVHYLFSFTQLLATMDPVSRLKVLFEDRMAGVGDSVYLEVFQLLAFENRIVKEG